MMIAVTNLLAMGVSELYNWKLVHVTNVREPSTSVLQVRTGFYTGHENQIKLACCSNNKFGMQTKSMAHMLCCTCPM